MSLIRFEPIFRRYLWGGHRLQSHLHKPTGDEACAESWEIVDHGLDQSVVARGPWKGKTLGDLVREHGRTLLGERLVRELFSDHRPPSLRGRFPLLFKFLDARQNLSIQVHPDDDMAASLSPPDLGKTEAWYVLDAAPGSRIYAGLCEGVEPFHWQQAVESGSVESLVHSFEPRVGDTIFVQAGTVHALGAGLLIAEIQQASDTTFRLFDWNRVDSQGHSRPLHLEAGLAATNYGIGPVQPVRQDGGHRTGDEQTVVACDAFTLRVHRGTAPRKIGGDGRFRILAATRGCWQLTGDDEEELSLGQTGLLPAESSCLTACPGTGAELLEVYIS